MKKLFYLLMALPLIWVGCNGGDDPVPEPKPEAPSFTLTSDSVAEFGAEGGEGTITYSYKAGTVGNNETIEDEINPIEVECQAEWIEVADRAALLGNVTYLVAENTTTEPREATINLSFKEFVLSVTIKQAAGEEPVAIKGWGIIGSMTNNWSLEDVILMEETNGYYKASGVTLTTNDSFKFIKDGDYAENRGGDGQKSDPDYYYTAQSWGSDIRISADGRYDIYLNAELDTYYIMSEGKSPAEALKPLAPGEDLVEACGNFDGAERVRLWADGRYLAAHSVKFSTTTAEFVISVNGDEKVYGAKNSATYDIDEAIELTPGDTKVMVGVESGVEYDIYYRKDMSSVWVMPAGIAPIIWNEVTGVAFSPTNYGLFLLAEGMELIFDFYCELSTNSIIPEGRYYVTKEDGSSDFNFDVEYMVRIEGEKSFLKDGYMDIKHIAGGYDITVDMTSIHNHVIKVHYAGPVGEVAIMGRPITNPE